MFIYEKVLECLQSPSIKNAATTDDAYLVDCALAGTCYSSETIPKIKVPQ